MRVKGYVVYFDETGGEGLIKSEQGQTLFLHYSSLPGYSRHSRVNAERFAPVSFEVVEGYKGPQAHKVQYLENKSKVNVCEDVLLEILDQPDDQDVFGKDWRLNNWLTSMGLCAKKEGHLVTGAFWDKR